MPTTLRSETTSSHVTTLLDYLHVVRRRKWVIIQAAVIVPLVAVFLASRQHPTYQASADVLLSSQSLAAALVGTPDQTGGLSSDQGLQTQAQIARVPEVARRAIAAAKVTDRTPDQLLAESSVTPSSTANILTFTVTDATAALAPQLATGYARAYIRYRRQLDTQALANASKLIQARLDQIAAQQGRSGQAYQTLVEKQQELETMIALQGSNASLIQTPTGASRLGPHTKRDVVLGIFLGLALGLCIAFLLEALDTRVRSATELSERLGLPLLARVPEPPRRLASASRLVMLADPTDTAAESFRMLRTNLEFVTLDRDIRSIMVTSAVEREGKTTTMANLGVAMARAGRRVVLVDLDLRRPSVDRFFDLSGWPGLTQVALGRVDLADALVRVPIDLGDRPKTNGATPMGSLAVLGAGPVPPDPGEFVATEALSSVLARLREIADVVLVDAPPLLHVGDTLTLSPRIDALVVVGRLETVKRSMIAEVKRALETMPIAKLGLIVTGANVEEGYYGSYYGGYGDPRDHHESSVARSGAT